MRVTTSQTRKASLARRMLHRASANAAASSRDPLHNQATDRFRSRRLPLSGPLLKRSCRTQIEATLCESITRPSIATEAFGWPSEIETLHRANAQLPNCLRPDRPLSRALVGGNRSAVPSATARDSAVATNGPTPGIASIGGRNDHIMAQLRWCGGHPPHHIGNYIVDVTC